MTGEKDQAVDNTQEVERIREIIFGSQMRDYQKSFQSIKRDLERLQEGIDRLSEQLSVQESNQNEKLQNLRKELRKADDDLRDELRQTAGKLGDEKVDRAVLGQLFTEVGAQLKSGGSLADLLKGLSALE